MNKLFTLFLSLVCCVAATAQVSSQMVMTVETEAGEPISFKVSEISQITFAEQALPECNLAEQEYVDLGLPSGTLWAKNNVKDEEGGHFSWGGKVSRTKFKETEYEFVGQSKYNAEDNLVMLDVEADDVARLKMDGDWQMPTLEDWNELRSYAAWCWMENYEDSGLNGYEVVGRNGNKIFLPAEGYRGASGLSSGAKGYYWSATLNVANVAEAYMCSFDSGSHSLQEKARYFGYSVRGICRTRTLD